MTALTTSAPATAPRTQRVLLVAAGAAFLALLDTTVANLAVSDIRTDFTGASAGDASWLITIYAVTFAACLAPAGRVADVVGRRALLLAGAGAFTALSVACALAPTLGMLLVARALQGIAAAAMIPASLAVVLTDTPAEKRAAAIGAWSAAGALAAAAGPALGGILVDTVGWRALFLINLPVGLAIVLGARKLIPATSTRRANKLPDLAGTVVLALGIGAAALGIAEGTDWGWTDERTLAAIGGGLAGIAYALHRSSRHATPAIETRMWRTRSFALANLSSLLYGAALFPWMLIGVLFLVSVWGYSPLQAGVAMTPGAVIAALVALRSGPLVASYGPRAVIVTGAAVLTIPAAIPAFYLPADPAFLTYWLPLGVLIGVGTGAITTGVSTAAALSVKPERFAAAVGLNQTGRQVGGALGLAVLAALLDQDATGSAIGPYQDVYLFIAVATAAVMAAAAYLKFKESPLA